MRLVGGDYYSEGRVEVYHSSSWGTICGDSWSLLNAVVICKQLGYPTAIEAIRNSRTFGRATGNIWLDNVYCTGNETNLADCRHSDWGIHHCTHYEDAGVRCANGKEPIETPKPG